MSTNADQRPSTKQLADDEQYMKGFLLQHGRKAATVEYLHGSIDALLEGLRGALKSHNEARRALEKRVAELEARPMPKYRGVHHDGDSYKANSMVTKAGALWFAPEDTGSTPGADGSWRLIVKRGEGR